MERVIGGVVGISAFVAVILYGADQERPFTPTLIRAFLFLLLGWGAGRWVFAPVGLALLREGVAQKSVRPGVVPEETKKSGEAKPESKEVTASAGPPPAAPGPPAPAG